MCVLPYFSQVDATPTFTKESWYVPDLASTVVSGKLPIVPYHGLEGLDNGILATVYRMPTHKDSIDTTRI